MSDMCIQKFWRGYDVRLHPDLADDGFCWESELAQLDGWLAAHPKTIPLDFIEVRPCCVLLVTKGQARTILLRKTPDGLKQEEI